MRLFKLDRLEPIVEALTIASGDYAADSRGDVGSWVREVTVETWGVLLQGLTVEVEWSYTKE